MTEARQAKDDLPDDVLSGPLGHTCGLLCRRHAQHCMFVPHELTRIALDERTGRFDVKRELSRRRVHLAGNTVFRAGLNPPNVAFANRLSGTVAWLRLGNNGT
jgi:hypothetical protein